MLQPAAQAKNRPDPSNTPVNRRTVEPVKKGYVTSLRPPLTEAKKPRVDRDHERGEGVSALAKKHSEGIEGNMPTDRMSR